MHASAVLQPPLPGTAELVPVSLLEAQRCAREAAEAEARKLRLDAERQRAHMVGALAELSFCIHTCLCAPRPCAGSGIVHRAHQSPRLDRNFTPLIALLLSFHDLIAGRGSRGGSRAPCVCGVYRTPGVRTSAVARRGAVGPRVCAARAGCRPGGGEGAAAVSGPAAARGPGAVPGPGRAARLGGVRGGGAAGARALAAWSTCAAAGARPLVTSCGASAGGRWRAARWRRRLLQRMVGQ